MEAKILKGFGGINPPYRCLIRENAYFWIVNVFFAEGRIERVRRYGRAKSRQASELGAQKSKLLGIPYFKNKKSIPGFVSAQQRAKQERKEAKIKQRIVDWQEWRKQYESDAIAVAELVQYLNRYIKRFSEKERRESKHSITFDVYDIKDKWLELNSKNITRAEISAQFNRRIYIYEDLYEEVNWGSPIQFFAYEIDVEGRIFKLHSKKKILEKILTFNPEAHGSAEPLEDSACILPLNRAITVASWCLKEVL
ncbi:MAG: hypothetical protein AB4372_23050 [Xenococcus sp. (in: cyanobacteria)]